MSKCIAVFSGGPDSTAAAIWAIDQGHEVELLTLHFYSPSQDSEIEAAKKVAELLGCTHTVADLRQFMPVFGPPVTVMMHGSGRTPAETSELSSSVMPFGAGFVLSLATSYALSKGCSIIVWGATKDDGFKRTEYRTEFGEKIAKIVRETYGIEFEILAPFANQHKFELMRTYLDRPDLFAATWSCTMGREIQSGNDGASISRRLAAYVAGIEDRTAYESKRLEIPEKLKDRSVSGISDAELSDWFRTNDKPSDL